MNNDHLLSRISNLQTGVTQIRWCDPTRLNEENADGVSPGGILNRFGYWVIATTIGGNAIAVSDGDPAIYFADHTWYHEDMVSYQDLAGKRDWIDLPLNRANVIRSLFKLADSSEEFRNGMASGELDQMLDSID